MTQCFLDSHIISLLIPVHLVFLWITLSAFMEFGVCFRLGPSQYSRRILWIPLVVAFSNCSSLLKGLWNLVGYHQIKFLMKICIALVSVNVSWWNFVSFIYINSESRSFPSQQCLAPVGCLQQDGIRVRAARQAKLIVELEPCLCFKTLMFCSPWIFALFLIFLKVLFKILVRLR